MLQLLAERSVVVLATNADTRRVREWYAWARVKPLVERHSIAANQHRRGAVGCVWITSEAHFELTRPVEDTDAFGDDDEPEAEGDDP